MRQLFPRVLALLTGLTLVPFSLQAAAPPGSTTQWILAVAKATGRNGEQFVSALRIVNQGPGTANVDLTYLGQSAFDSSRRAAGDNGAVAAKRVTVPAGQTWASEDIIGTLFADAPAPFGIGAGGIRIASDIPVEVVSKTYVANAKSATGVAGSFGFTIPSLGLDQLIGLGDTGVIPFVAASSAGDKGFRSNLILQSASPDALSDTIVSVKLVRADGSTVGSQDYALGRLSSGQILDVAAALGVTGDNLNLRLGVTVKTGGPIAAGLSLIDNAIASITYVPASAYPSSGRFGWILSDDTWQASAGRLDVEGGAPNFLSGIVTLSCGAGTFVYPFLAYGTGSVIDASAVNTTFSLGVDGNYAFSGRGSDGTTWSGTLRPWGDGTIRGTLTFTAGSSTQGCPSASSTFALQAARIQNLPK